MTQAEAVTLTPHDSHGTAELALGFAAFGALGIVIPVLALLSPDTGRSTAWFITFGIMLVSAVRLAFLIAGAERRMFEFIFWLFSYVFFGLAPTVQLRADALATTTLGLDPALDTPTAVTGAVGIASFAVGFFIARRVRTKTETTSVTTSISVFRLSVLTVIAIGASGYYVSRLGPGVLFSSRAEFSTLSNLIWPDPTTSAMIAAVSSFPIVIAAHGWWSIGRSSRDRRARAIAWITTVIALLVTNPISSARYHFGVVWGSFLGPLGAYRTRLRTSLTMIAIVFGLMFVFPLADMFRRATGASAERAGFLAEYEGNGDYDAFGQLSNAILYDATMPFRFARQFLGIVFFWVPRSIWSDKPTGSGVLLGEFREYRFTNLSAPIWAEILLSFGFVGVVVVSVLLGYLLGRLDSRSLVAKPSPIAEIAGYVFPFYLLILMRGSLLQATGILVVLIASLLFISRREKSPPTQAAAGSS